MKVAGCGLRFPGAQPSSKKRNLLLSLRADFYPPRGGTFRGLQASRSMLEGKRFGMEKSMPTNIAVQGPTPPIRSFSSLSGHIGTYRDKSGHQAFGMYYLCIVNTGWDKLLTITHRHRHHLRSDLVQGRVEKTTHLVADNCR